MENQEIQIIKNEVPVYEQAMRAQLDVQIITAKAYPRDLMRVRNNAIAIVTMDSDTAKSCGYELPRGGKSVSGPSVHLARILAQQYSNIRAESRVTQITDKYLVSEAIAHDLETNYAVKVEVRRKIIDRRGNRYNEDMITVTGNAANSISYRNAVLAVIPKSIIDATYKAARNKITGDLSTEEKLIEKRKKVLDGFKSSYGVNEPEILEALGLRNPNQIKADEIASLIGMAQAIKDGDSTVDELFGKVEGINKDGEKIKSKADNFADDGPDEKRK